MSPSRLKGPAAAIEEDVMEFPKPSEHHRVLDRLLGDWLFVTSTGMEGYDPDDPDKRWTEKVRSIGGLWVVAEGDGQTLVLEAEGPGMDDPERNELYRDVIHFIDDDNRRFSGSIRKPNRSFHTFITSVSKRIG
jgi:hypothetical protein